VRSTGAVAAPEVVAVATAMAACYCRDTASTVAVCSQEAADAAWTVPRATTKSDKTTPEVADATALVSGSMGSGVAMVEVGSGWSGPWSLVLGRSPGAEWALEQIWAEDLVQSGPWSRDLG
jgi:hypothetical protein